VSEVAFERRDGLAVITLSRPDRLNAVTPAMGEELFAILDRAGHRHRHTRGRPHRRRPGLHRPRFRDR
jgi:enoyl-CoA hydratase/carnithine racemase